MGKHIVQITNGKGTIHLTDGTYKATALAEGYDVTTLEPKEVLIEQDKDTYAFTISATGTLTIHVTDAGEQSGSPVSGAKFIRTTNTGTSLGIEAISGQDGNAIFNNVPFSESGNIKIYYRQITSDGEHTFIDTLKTVTMTNSTLTEEISNPLAPLRNLTLTDISLPNITIEDAQIILEDT